MAKAKPAASPSKTKKSAAKTPARATRATPKKVASKPATAGARTPAAKKSAPRAKTSAPPAKQSAPSPSARPPARPASKKRGRVIVPDTSVIVDGRITMMMQRGEIEGARILIPEAVVAELEHQANAGRESGFNGLDEVVKIQQLKDVAECEVEFVGERPTSDAIRHADVGEIDAIIRGVAKTADATLFTSDRVQAHVARAVGISVEYVRPVSEPDDVAEDLGNLEIMQYFDDDTMSVHLKYGVRPLAKRGRPGDLELVELSEETLPLKALTRMRGELIEAAKRDANSFVEIERHGATVIQLGPMRIAIAQPPFSDGLEITAVRPVVKLDLSAYDLKPDLRDRLESYQRGVFVSGPPGSGKSTFVTAIAEWLESGNTIVKTMESPRDLQVSDAITQYAPLEGDMALTSDVLLLVRPDYVVYDEVRRTDDFKIFADMRLAGVGLIGVTHANRGIDAIQRLIGRVELGMIPQVVDTVVHIDGGKITEVLELSFTVKTPAGMQEADLARPVIEVRDFVSGKVTHEIYTYGEQVVVMPVGAGGAEATSGRDKLAARELKRNLRGVVDGPIEIEMTGDNSAALYVHQREIARVVGKAGANVKQLETEVGLSLDIRSLETFRKSQREAAQAPKRGRQDAGWDDDDEDARAEEEEFEASVPSPRVRRYAELRPEIRKSKKFIALLLPRDLGGHDVEIVVDDATLFRGTLSNKGELRIQRRTREGEMLGDALARGGVVMCRV